MRRPLHEARHRVQRDGASALGADQRTRHVEAVLGQQLIEVVARYAASELGKPRADHVRVAVAKPLECRVDFAAPAAFGDDPFELRAGSGPDPHARAVVGEYLQRFHVLDGLAGHHRVRAAGIVADHPAERAAAVGCRIGTKSEPVCFGRIAQCIAHDAGLDTRGHRSRINLQHAVQVLRSVDHHCDVDALSALGGAAAARQEWRVERTTRCDRCDDIVNRPGKHDTDRYLAVVRCVGRIRRADAGVEAHDAFDARAQRRFQGGSVERGHGLGRVVCHRCVG